jgi:hypothetical protein
VSSKRVNIAKQMAESTRLPNKDLQESLGQAHWLEIIYAFEAEGFAVVPNNETLEYQGLRNALDDDK